MRIFTPAGCFFEGQVRQVVLPGEMAPFTILPRHQAIVSTLVRDGRVRMELTTGEHRIVECAGVGLVEYHDGVVELLAEGAHDVSLSPANEA